MLKVINIYLQRNLDKNSFSSLLASLFSLVVGLGISIIATQEMSKYSYNYTLILSITSFALLFEAGLSQQLLRELVFISIKKNRWKNGIKIFHADLNNHYFICAALIYLTMSTLSIISIILALYFLTISITKILVIALCVGVVVLIQINIFNVYLNSNNKIYLTKIGIISNKVSLIISFILLNIYYTVDVSFILSFVFGNIVNLIFLYIVSRDLISYKITFDKEIFLDFIRSIKINVLRLIYIQIATYISLRGAPIIIALYYSEKEVIVFGLVLQILSGIYSTSYSVYAASIPLMTNWFQSGRKWVDLQKNKRNFSLLLMIFGLSSVYYLSTLVNFNEAVNSKIFSTYYFFGSLLFVIYLITSIYQSAIAVTNNIEYYRRVIISSLMYVLILIIVGQFGIQLNLFFLIIIPFEFVFNTYYWYNYFYKIVM